jgi:DNA-binding beta-propeller fold protein YncE
MKGKVWKLMGLLSIMIFVLSAANTVHAQTQITGVGVYPTAVAYDSGTHEVFVVNPDAGTLSVISDSSDSVTQTVSGLSFSPFGLAYDSGKGEMFVSEFQQGSGSAVQIIPDSTYAVSGTINVSGLGMAYDSSRGYMYICNGIISVYSDSSNSIIANITNIEVYGSCAYDSGTHTIWATPQEGVNVYVINDQNNEVTKSIQVAYLNPYEGPGNPTYDPAKGYIYVTNGTDVSVISDKSYKIVAVIHNVGGSLVYAGNDEIISSNGAVISDKTNTVTATLNVGTNPAGIAYDSSTGQIFVTNSNDPGTVTYTPVSSGTAVTATPTSSSSSTSTATSTPKVPEFSSAALISVAAAMIALTVSAVTLKARTKKALRK